jgi:hypothetical protein
MNRRRYDRRSTEAVPHLESEAGESARKNIFSEKMGGSRTVSTHLGEDELLDVGGIACLKAGNVHDLVLVRVASDHDYDGLFVIGRSNALGTPAGVGLRVRRVYWRLWMDMRERARREGGGW